MPTRDQLAEKFGITWFPHQLEALDGEAQTNACDLRACLYFATGKGKTYTALALLAQAGVADAVVVAPLKTHAKWHYDAALAGIQITTMSHAKYRQKTTKFPKLKPVIIDEFHMLGGAQGAGWKKLRVQARFMQAPLIILSATPNYNDVERVYCVEHILNVLPGADFLNWLYRHCDTEQNHFGMMPLVIGFRDGRPAKEHLAELPHVYYIEDPHENFPVADIQLATTLPDAFEEYGLDHREQRIMASHMEAQSARRKLHLIGDDGLLRPEVYDELIELAGQTTGPVLVFCARSTIARAAYVTALEHNVRAGLVTYTPKQDEAIATLEAFRRGELDVLFGTATMSTGVDGLDKVCDMLILLDDTDDDSLRRQVIGRILPRGTSSDISKKIVARLRLPL